MKFHKVAVATVAAGMAIALAACSGEPINGNTDGSSGGGANAQDVGAYLSDPRFRQALKLAVDMPAIIDGTMNGMAEPASTLMPPGPYRPTSGLDDWAYDPERAQELLDEIGWDSSIELGLVYYYADQATVDFMSAVQQYLAAVGVQVAPRMLEGDLASQLWTKPQDAVAGPSAVDWDLAYAAVAALAPQEYYDRFLSTYPGNSYWPLDEEFESLVEATSESADPGAQAAAFSDVIGWENANLPAVPLYYQPIFIVESDDVDRNGHDYGNEQYNYDWGIVEWTVPENADGDQVLQTNGGAEDFFSTPFVNPGLFMSVKVLYDHLLVASADLSSFEPQLAESYEVSDDGTTVTLTMRDDAVWHDGESLTAEDVKFTFELAAQASGLHAVFDSTIAKITGSQAFRDGDADEISGIQVDGNTVTITFDEVDPSVLLTLSQLPPLPEHLLAEVDPLQLQQDPYFQEPVGSGPFQVEEVRMGDYTVFSAFDDYWDGRPQIDQIEMYPSTEADPNLVTNVQSGNVDYAYTKSVDDATAIEGVDGITVHSVDVMYTRLFFVNSFPRD